MDIGLPMSLSVRRIGIDNNCSFLLLFWLPSSPSTSIASCLGPLEIYSFHSKTHTTYGSYEGFTFRAFSIFTASFPLGAWTGRPWAFEPLVGLSFSSFDHSWDKFALALERGCFFSGWPPS